MAQNAVTEPRDSYSPERRTALLFTGTGADGAYHAGAMRALQEAGVKVDLVCGRGVGAIAAVLGAVDGGSQLWEANGFWRSPAIAQLYRWRWPFTVLRWLGIALLAVLAIPAVIILVALEYPLCPPARIERLRDNRHQQDEYRRLRGETTRDAGPTR